MLNALFEGAVCLPSSPNSTNIGAANVTAAHAGTHKTGSTGVLDDSWLDACILVAPSIAKHCLLDFRIWRRAKVSTWARAVALCTAIVSPTHCRFHQINLAQLRCACIFARSCACVCVCARVCVCVSVCLSVSASLPLPLCVRLCVSVSVCPSVCLCLCLCVCSLAHFGNCLSTIAFHRSSLPPPPFSGHTPCSAP